MSAPEEPEAAAGRSGEDPDFAVGSVEFPVDLPPRLQEKLIDNEKGSARRGAVIGGLVILAGVVLLVLGVSGSVDISLQDGSTSGHVNTGSLGIVVVLVGGAIVWATRQKVKVTAAGRRPG